MQFEEVSFPTATRAPAASSSSSSSESRTTTHLLLVQSVLKQTIANSTFHHLTDQRKMVTQMSAATSVTAASSDASSDSSSVASSDLQSVLSEALSQSEDDAKPSARSREDERTKRRRRSSSILLKDQIRSVTEINQDRLDEHQKIFEVARTRSASEPKQRRSVSFGPHSKVYSTISLVDMTDAEMETYWHTPEDLQRIQQDVVQTITTIRLSSVDGSTHNDDEDICMRGLENIIDSTFFINRRNEKNNHIDDVLDDQNIQFESGEFDEGRIATIASRSSQSSRNRAIHAGALDAAFKSNLETNDRLFLEQCVEDGIDPSTAHAAQMECQRLEDYYWQKGHEREAEAAAHASGEALKKGGVDPDVWNKGHSRSNGGGDDRGKDLPTAGPKKITLPSSMASQAKSIQLGLKKDAVQLLRNASGDSSNPRFMSALKVLSSIYTGQGYDARAVPTNSNDVITAAPSPDATFEGEWTLQSRPTFPDNLGKNKNGNYLYTLSRMSFSMLSPGDVICSIQSIKHCINLVSDEELKMVREEEGGSKRSLPRKLLEIIEKDETARRGLRRYDTKTFLTVEPKGTSSIDDPTQDESMPLSRVRAVMSTRGFIVPDGSEENRFTVWFTGGSLRPAEHTNLAEWEGIFQSKSDTGKFQHRRTFRERATVLAAKLLLGAEIPQALESDGSMSFRFHRPIPGHIDVLYYDDTLLALRGNRGTIMVQSREGVEVPKELPEQVSRRITTKGQAKVA